MKNDEWKAEHERLVHQIVSAAKNIVIAEKHSPPDIEVWVEELAIRRAALLAHLDTRPEGEGEPSDLRFVRENLAYWVEWDERTRAAEGLATDDDTYVMNGGFKNAPPSWPSHGVLKRWIATIDAAISTLAAPPPHADALDAKRYAWLREHWNDDFVIGMERTPEQLDQFIDNALKTGRIEP